MNELKPKNPIGFSVTEIAAIAGVGEDDVEAAIAIGLRTSQMPLSETGERLIYPVDAPRLLREIERQKAEGFRQMPPEEI